MNPVRGSGLAAATTTTSWSALATTARSIGSVSSALRRSRVLRSWIFTSRARVSGVAGHVAHEGHEVAGHHRGAAEFPGAGGDDGPLVAGVLAHDGRVAPAVNGDDAPGDGVLMAGRSLVRGRVPFLVGPDPDVGLVPGISAACHRGSLRRSLLGTAALPCASMSAHSCGKSGMVLAVVAMSCDFDAPDGQAEDGARRWPSGGRRSCGRRRHGASRAG